MTHKISSIPKFLILASLFSIILFDYTLLRNVKDMLIISHPEGIQAIPALKTMFVPAFQIILLVIFLVSYRAPGFPKAALIGIASFLAIAALLIFMGEQQLPPEQIFVIHKGLYITAELFGTFAVGVLFGVLANQSFTLQEAKLAYPFLGLVSILVALGMSQFSGILNAEGTLNQFSLICAGSAIVVLVLSFVFHTKQIGAPLDTRENTQNVNVYSYLGLIFLIVSLLFLSQNITDFVFKAQIKNIFPDHSDYNAFIGSFLNKMGIYALPLFLMSFWMVRVFGWKRSALITPIFILLSTLLMISSVYCESLQNLLGTLFNINPKESLLWLIASQKVILAGIIPTLFITVKEMAFIALPYSAGAKGKVTIELLTKGTTALLGMSIVSFYMTLTSPGDTVGEISFLSITNHTLLWLVVGFSILWVLSVIALSKKYTLLSGDK